MTLGHRNRVIALAAIAFIGAIVVVNHYRGARLTRDRRAPLVLVGTDGSLPGGSVMLECKGRDDRDSTREAIDKATRERAPLAILGDCYLPFHETATETK